MRTVIRQIEEERLVVVALEERERGGSLRFQPIPGLFNDGAVRVQRLAVAIERGEVAVLLALEAFIKNCARAEYIL